MAFRTPLPTPLILCFFALDDFARRAFFLGAFFIVVFAIVNLPLLNKDLWVNESYGN